MKKTLLRCLVPALVLSMTAGLCACGQSENSGDSIAKTYENAMIIALSEVSATLDGAEVEEFDYTWHCDPSTVHDEVKNAPAEYHTGTKPDTDAAVYIDCDLPYFPQLPESGFELVNYDGEAEWAYRYTDGENDEYIFATLPRLGNSLPSQMMHSEAEAAENKVLHITKAGTYVLQGTWKGQVLIDLGDKDDTFADETAKVTLILDGADISCSVAPGIVFYSAYECDNTWEDRESYSSDVDTSDAGVNVIIADDSENTVNGTNIFRMLKTVYKDEDSTDPVKTQKKLRKLDGAFYSYVSMNITGEESGSGTLTVNAGFEGIDSELHLTINGGIITVNSQDDGMNVNEDHVSVITVNGGDITINAALGAEGDGIDSNGFIVVNGGKLSINGITRPDDPLDSDDGVIYNGGTVIVDGQETTDFGNQDPSFGRPEFGGVNSRDPMEQDFDIKEFKAQVAALGDDATLEDVMELLGMRYDKGFEGDGQPFDVGGEAPTGMQQPPEAP